MSVNSGGGVRKLQRYISFVCYIHPFAASIGSQKKLQMRLNFQLYKSILLFTMCVLKTVPRSYLCTVGQIDMYSRQCCLKKSVHWRIRFHDTSCTFILDVGNVQIACSNNARSLKNKCFFENNPLSAYIYINFIIHRNN